jgi:DNA-binding CsgD family transcriptional regulator
MNPLKRMLAFFRLPPLPARSFTLDQELQRSLLILAEQEQRTPQEVAAGLIHAALQSRQQSAVSWRHWQALSPREQQIAAQVCLNYTTRQVAMRLGIAPDTVKTHVRNILAKFEVGSRQELRQLLAGWDFSSWE